jgi:hypothetical protein
MMKTLVVALALCLPVLVTAHVSMTKPIPRQAGDPNMNAPIGQFWPYPCQGRPKGAVTATLTAGQSTTVTFNTFQGGMHTDGACQFAVSYDNGNTFHVIHSTPPQQAPAACPAHPEDFVIPADLPACKSCVFAWTWVWFAGSQLYMNCADVTIDSTASNMDALAKYPPLTIVNIGTCPKTSFTLTDLWDDKGVPKAPYDQCTSDNTKGIVADKPLTPAGGVAPVVPPIPAAPAAPATSASAVTTTNAAAPMTTNAAAPTTTNVAAPAVISPATPAAQAPVMQPAPVTDSPDAPASMDPPSYMTTQSGKKNRKNRKNRKAGKGASTSGCTGVGYTCVTPTEMAQCQQGKWQTVMQGVPNCAWLLQFMPK